MSSMIGRVAARAGEPVTGSDGIARTNPLGRSARVTTRRFDKGRSAPTDQREPDRPRSVAAPRRGARCNRVGLPERYAPPVTGTDDASRWFMPANRHDHGACDTATAGRPAGSREGNLQRCVRRIGPVPGRAVSGIPDGGRATATKAGGRRSRWLPVERRDPLRAGCCPRTGRRRHLRPGGWAWSQSGHATG